MNVFLGVDGGGSKTEFLLIDAAGGVLATSRAGSAYYLETGIDALQALLCDGIRTTLARASLTLKDITFACIGVPAYGENSALTGRLDAIVSPLLPESRYRCVNDMVCGWAGALGGGDGINVVAGTGSIGYGEFAGRQARAGGWGELFSDEGSAYWVAREVLSAFSRMSDGRLARSALYERVRSHFGVSQDLDVCAAIYGPPALPRSAFAALSPLAANAARDGDPVARRIFTAAADELIAIVEAVRAGLAVPDACNLPVSYSGGLFSLHDVLVPAFEKALQSLDPRYVLVTPRLRPSAGAALYAAMLAQVPLSADALDKLSRTHGAVAQESA